VLLAVISVMRDANMKEKVRSYDVFFYSHNVEKETCCEKDWSDKTWIHFGYFIVTKA
jgi:hypothetical protein